MESFLIYIGKSALAAGAFYLVFLVLFQNRKQFLFNRIYLPASLAVSFLIPLITFTSVRYIEAKPMVFSNSFAYLPEETVSTVAKPEIVWTDVLFLIYISGIILFLGYLILGHYKAFRIVRGSKLKELFGMAVNVTDKDVHPFSFFNKIVLSEKTARNPNLEMIVQHEHIHVRERHTIDILVGEILFLFQWFNPFAWLIKDAMKNNLEYLTDHQVTQHHNAEAYQLAMVGLADKKGVAPFLTALNGSQLKNRIIMMKQKSENKYSLLKQLVVLPLLAVLIMGLSTKEVKTEIIQNSGESIIKDKTVTVMGVISDNILQKPIEGATVRLENSSNQVLSDESGKYEMKLSINSPVVLEFSAKGYFSNQVSYYGEEELNVVLAQLEKKHQVSGKVTDENETALKGATVLVKDAEKGVITDQEGNYKISTDAFATLVFVMPGFEQQEVAVNNQSTIDVKLSVENNQEKKPITLTSSGLKVEPNNNSGGFKVMGDLKAILKDSGTDIFATSKEGIRISATGKDAPLFIVNGRKVPTIEELNPDDIASISVLKEASASALYGDLGKNGVLLITTKSGSKNVGNGNIKENEEVIHEPNSTSSEDFTATEGKTTSSKDNGSDEVVEVGYGGQVINKKIPDEISNLLINSSENEKPLIIVDGKKVPNIDGLNSENIKVISVLKGASASDLYGDSGKNGVILITTKSGEESAIKSEYSLITFSDSGSEKMKILSSNGKSPLVIVNDEKYKGEINDISPEDISSVSVLKGESACRKYGEEATDGVIIIQTKDYTLNSLHELRKFIAEKIIYPVKAQKANREGVVKLGVKIAKDGAVSKILEEFPESAEPLDEVIVTGYKSDKVVGEGIDLTGEVLKNEVERVVNSFPLLDIPELKGKNLIVTVKFVLQ